MGRHYVGELEDGMILDKNQNCIASRGAGGKGGRGMGGRGGCGVAHPDVSGKLFEEEP
jgi:hypothetical protein